VGWDERFTRALSEGGAPDPPAAWLLAHRTMLASKAPGRALDVACGLGRHSVLLAQLGFEVDAVDGSRVALGHLERVAAERSLPITTTLLDLSALPPLPRPPYAVAVVTNYLQRDLLPGLIEGLEPGGLLAVEAFLAQPTADWGPSAPEMVLASGELERLLAGTEILFADETPHRGRVKARVLAAR
jgi:tellurite methyltransferase